MSGSSRVTVLLCAFNGLAYLKEQLDSIGEQDYPRVGLVVSDDGSVDGTKAFLAAYAEQWGRAGGFSYKEGPSKGSTQHFLSLVCADDIEGDYFAYADQDDIWDSDKLSRAISALADCPFEVPALYCSRTRTISDSPEAQSGQSPLFRGPPSFANALVHNIGGGNTMVMNVSARNLLRRAGMIDVVAHDWWTYLLVSGAGGYVIYDPISSLSYRQHADNQIGANTGFKPRLKRYLGALGGRNKDWNARNIAALESNAALLSEDNRQRLRVFSESRNGGLFTRLKGVKRAGLYAQTFTGNLGLFFATLLKKI